MNEYVKSHPSYTYAKNVVNGDEIANKEIYKICKQFVDDINDESSKYWFDNQLLRKITRLLGLIAMGDGLRQGKPVKDSLAGFQWLFIASTLCWKMESDHSKRRYTKSVLLIARKNGKTFLVALIFIILLLTEPPHSTFFSVAPDLDLSSIIKTEIENILDASPEYIKEQFQWTKKKITCKVNSTSFEPLATSKNRMDGRMAAVFVADEVGALRNNYPISAMKSSQLTIHNPLGVLISTAYPSLENPMQEEVDASQKILDDSDRLADTNVFSMLYKPDNPKEWQYNDDELLKANPLAAEIDDIRSAITETRQEAVDMPSKRSNFLTKHMNIFVDGNEGEQYVTETELESAELREEYDWYGKDVYVGIDLSQSGDNTAVSMVGYDESHNKYIGKSWAFYPIQKQDEKKRVEHIDYALMDKEGYSFGCGSKTVDYKFVEDFICNLSDKYGVNIKGIGYDKWNALATVNSLTSKDFDMFEIAQNAKGLYPGTKLLREALVNEDFHFEKNDLLKKNFLNATMVYDMNLSYYLNKKKSNGKIDMVAALVNCMVLWEREEQDGAGDYLTGIQFL